MENSQELGYRLKEVLLTGRWIANTNLQEQLTSISAENAVQCISGCNSIAALTYHLLYYLKGLLAVLQGGSLDIRDADSFNMPTLHNDEDWKALVSEFVNTATNFIFWVSKMDQNQLDGPFVEPKYGTWRRNLEGVIEHSYYHLGQIVLLRKLGNLKNE